MLCFLFLHWKDLWEFNTENNKWQQIEPKSDTKPEGIVYHSAVVYKNQMILYGGYKMKKPCTELWTLNLGELSIWLILAISIDTFEWKRLEDAPLAPRSGHAAAVIGDSMYIFGGEGANDKGVTCENDFWVFNLGNLTIEVLFTVQDHRKWEEVKLETVPDKRLGSKGVALAHQFVVTGGIKVSSDWNAEAWFNDTWTYH